MMTMMDSDREPTETDLTKMDRIAAELQVYGDSLLQNLRTEGRA